MPETVVVPIVVFWFAGGFVGGWFLGGWYKSRRTSGMTKQEVIDEGKATLTAEYNQAMAKAVELREKLKGMQ